MFIWKCLQNCLAVRDNILKFSSGKDKSCPLCGLHEETIQHLFCECQITHRIWYALDSNLFLPAINSDFNQWFINTFNDAQFSSDLTQSKIRFICLGMWAIWKYRCTVVFENLQVNPSDMLTLAKKEMNEWEYFLSKSNRTKNTGNRIRAQWCLPKSQYEKINIDASYDSKSTSYIVGIGLILRNETGTFGAAKGKTTRADRSNSCA